MSKDLKKEYTGMIENDLPDLWDRISASLPEKHPVTEEQKPKKTKIYRFAGLAAACVCIAVLVPVVIMTNRTSVNNAAAGARTETAEAAWTETRTEARTAAAGADEEKLPAEALAPQKESSENAAEAAVKMFSAATASVGSDRAQQDEAAMEEAAEAEESNSMKSAALGVTKAESAGTDSMDAAADALPAPEAVPEPESLEAESTAEEAAAYEAADAAVTADVSVDIKKVIEEGKNARYLAEVVEVPDGAGLKKGEEIVVVCDGSTPEDVAESLEGGTITLDLEQTDETDENGHPVYLVR